MSRLVSSTLLPALALVVPLVAGGECHAQGAVLRGPYLLEVSTTSIKVVWESPAPSTGVVRFGAGSVNEGSRASGAAARHQRVVLDGLLPNTSYVMRVEIEGHGSFDGSFRTAPSGAEPFAFVVYGDNRSNPAQHQAVVDAILAEPTPVSFLVNTGDLVGNGQRESDWDAFFPVARPLLLEQPLWVAIGNHEVDGGSFSLTRRLFELERAFFQVVYGNVQLIVLNVEVDNLFDFASGDQVDFLRGVLATRPPGVDHRFVFIHQGPYSSKPGRSGNFWMRRWLDDFDEAGIDVIFSGHDHYAERGWSQRGIPYVIHGGGGAPLYDHLGLRTTADHTIVYGETRLGYAVVEVDGPKVEVTMRGLEGEVVSYFAYGDAAHAECATANDCGAAPAYACAGGAWECRRSACEYTCPADSGFSLECLTNFGCRQRLGATCTGEARCESAGLQRFCVCDDENECALDADCASRPPPVPGCSGAWSCEDAVCGFTPTDGLCGQPAPDAGPADPADPDDPTDPGDPGDPADPGDPGASSDAGPAHDGDGGPEPPPEGGGPSVPDHEPPDAPAGCASAGGPLGPRHWLAGLSLLALLGCRSLFGRRGPRRAPPLPG
jgi:acid phosphatase type 7